MAKNAPVARFRIGYVTASVWENEGNGDSTFYSVDVQRTYKDGDELKNTTSLGHGDLLNAAKCLERAEHFIASQS